MKIPFNSNSNLDQDHSGFASSYIRHYIYGRQLIGLSPHKPVYPLNQTSLRVSNSGGGIGGGKMADFCRKILGGGYRGYKMADKMAAIF